MERRGRIPVAKFRTQEGKTRSRSRVREPDYNDQDPETDLFTLIEDNIALKEENKTLKAEVDEIKSSQQVLVEEKNQQHAKLIDLERRQADLVEEIQEITGKCTRANNERNALDKLHKIEMEKIKDLESQLLALQIEKDTKPTNEVVQSTKSIAISNNLKQSLLKILPELSGGNLAEMESLVQVDSTTSLTVTSEIVERLVDEFLALKNSMNTVELQLYEANEKISELLENQHHLEEESEVLRSENTNLTKVAKLLTSNMKESVETSKKMEAALLKLKRRNDELMNKVRDNTDGQQTNTPLASPSGNKENEEFAEIQQSIENQNHEHNERIVEMRNLVAAALAKTTNDELKTLKLQIEILEEELRKANARAEYAEQQLEKYKQQEDEVEIRAHEHKLQEVAPPPPPPPPPLPATLLYKAASLGSEVASDHFVNASFSDSIASHNLHNNSYTTTNSNDNGNCGDIGNKIINSAKRQVQPGIAKGIDAMMDELKSGRVTLRRTPRKSQTNIALHEMFQVLELSKEQNRNSQICMDLHI